MKNKLFHVLSDFFLLIFFLFFWLLVKPDLIYHFQQLGFSSDANFFKQYINYPGGLAEYFSLFLFQFNYKPLAGALVFTFLLSLISFLAEEIFKDSRKGISFLLKFIPIVFLAVLFTDYSFHPIYSVQIFSLFLFFYLIVLIFNAKIRLAFKLMLSGILLMAAYYISGGLTFFILAVSLIIYLFLIKRDFNISKVIILLVALLFIPFIAANFISFINIEDAYLKFSPYFSNYKPGIITYSLFFLLPFVLIIDGLLSLINRNKPQKEIDSKKCGSFIIQYLIAVVMLICGIIFSVNKDEKHKITIDKLAHDGKWEEILEKVKAKPSDDRLIQFHTNRALFFTGSLPEKMFDYHQIWGLDGLFINRYFTNEVLLPTTELFFELGLINEAIQYGNESISQNDNSPLIIEQLIISNIVSDKYSSAQIYINQLKGFRFFKKKALEYEKYIKGGEVPQIDSLVISKREIMPVTDFIVKRHEPQSDLINMLRDNLNNKMAYEYLMAAFLLDNDLASFVKYYSVGKKFNYKTIPTIYQQALISYNYEMMRLDKPMKQINVSKEVLDSFNEYMSIFAEFEGDKEAAQNKLKENFSNTYWYYLHYVSPVTNKAEIVVQ